MSRVLSAEVVATQRAIHPGIEVTYRDLAADPLGHLTGIHFAGLKGYLPADREGVRDLAAGQAALNEFLVADIARTLSPAMVGLGQCATALRMIPQLEYRRRVGARRAVD